MPPGSEPSKPTEGRRPHTKSRKGCLVCKQRRVKCDEVRPQCGKCAIGDRVCVYAPTKPQSAPTTPGRNDRGPGNAHTQELARRLAAQASLGPGPGPGIEDPVAGGQDGHYSTLHMILLYHAASDHSRYTSAPEMSRLFLRKALESSLEAPYVLEAFLALLALNISFNTTDTGTAAIIRRHAATLQNRALGMFNSCTDHPEGRLESNFLFAATVGTHVLGETLHDHMGSLKDFLGAYTEFTHVYRGVRTVIDTRWEDLLNSELAPMLYLSRYLGREDDDLFNGPETLKLRRQIEAMATPGNEPSLDALNMTQRLINFSKMNEGPADAGINAVSAWPMLVMPEFIDLLYQRRPESLAVMAFYGAMMHQNRSYWVFSDSGGAMVRMIVNHVGPFWADALAWPLQVISSQDEAPEASGPSSSQGDSIVNTPMSH